MTDSEKLTVALEALEALEPTAHRFLERREAEDARYQERWFLAWQQAGIVVRALDEIRGHGEREESCTAY